MMSTYQSKADVNHNELVRALELIMKNLDAARQRKGWTWRELSRRSGVSEGMISLMRRGQRTPTVNTVDDLAHALGLDFAALLSPEGTADELLTANQVRNLFLSLGDENRKAALQILRGLQPHSD